jgi:intracellular septation protein
MTQIIPPPPIERTIHPLLKLALELGPLGVFFVANQRGGIMTATGIFMVATLIALSAHYVLVRKLPMMPLISGAVVLIFGGLTLWLNDELFIKLKPTIVNTLFGVILIGGLLMGKSLLAYVLDSVFRLTDEGWRKLTWNWAWFFLALAVINEVVWRNFSTDFWVSFKVFGMMPITFIFAMSQAPILMRHEDKSQQKDV